MTTRRQIGKRPLGAAESVPLSRSSQVPHAVRATLASAGMGLLITPMHSRAEAECGSHAPSVVCSPGDYSSGISYQNEPAGGPTDVPGLQLILEDDLIVNTTSGQDGVAIEKSGTIGLTTGQNVSVTVGVTGVGDRDGMRVDSINGNVTVDSHANVDVDNFEGDGIIARSNSVDNEAPTFPDGKSHGAGNVAVTSSGTIHVRGDRSTGITAGSSGLTTTVTVTGDVTTEGASESAAVLVQNNRDPNALGVARATVTGADLQTIGSESAGIGVAAERGSAVVNVVRDAVLGGSISTQGVSSMGIGVATGLTELYTIDSSIASVGVVRGTGATVNNGTAGSTANDGVGIATQGEWAFGIGALSKGGAVTILNRGDIATRGDVGTGIAVLSSYVGVPPFSPAKGGAININNTASIVTGDSTDSTLGGSAAGIAALAFSADITVNSSGAITTYGDTIPVPAFQGIGLTARSAGIQAVVTRPVGSPFGGLGDVRVTTASTGTIHTEGLGAKGINAQSYSGLAQVVANGQITTLGDDADGVDALSMSGAINITAAEIATQGTNAYGVRATSSSGAVTVNSYATIATRGAQARGIHTQTTTGAISITAAGVSTEGNNADGIRGATTGGSLTAAVGDISTGAVSLDGMSLLGGTSSYGLYLNRNAATVAAITANTTSGTIRTRGNNASGINAVNAGGAVTVTSADISTGIVSADGATLLGGTSSYGIEASSSGSTAAAVVTVDSTGGSVTTRGNSAHAVYATSTGGAVNLTAGDISTGVLSGDNMSLLGGNNSHGLSVGGYAIGVQGAVSVDTTAGAVRTRGNGAHGLNLTSNGNPVTVALGDISTGALTADDSALLGGAGAFGVNLFALGLAANDSVLLDTTAGTISTRGNDAKAIGITSLGAVVNVLTGDVTTGVLNGSGTALLGGANAHAIHVANSAAGAEGAVAISTTAGTVATRGDNAHGIFATSTEGTIAISTGDVSTGAFAADGVTTLGGTAAHGVHSESFATGAGGPSAIDTTGGTITTRGNDAIGVFVSAAASAIEIASGAISTTGEGASGIWAEASSGAITIDTSDGAIATLGGDAIGISAQSDGAVAISAANVNTSGAAAAGIFAISRSDTAAIDAQGAVAAIGQSSPAIVAVSRTSTADVIVANGASIRGGWNVTPGAIGANDLTGAGVILGGAMGTREQAALLDNNGTISAASDFAIASADHYASLAASAGGGVRVENRGTVTGYLSLGSGANVFNNYSPNSYNFRHFADTNGDGAPDTERVAISDFGGPGALFDNTATGTVRLSSVIGASTVEAGGTYIPAGLNASFHDVTVEGIEQGHLVNLATFRNAGIITMQDLETDGTAPVAGDILVITGGSAAGIAGGGSYISDGGQLRLDVMLDEGGANSRSDLLVVDGTQLGGGGATRVYVANAGGLGDWTVGDGIKIVDVLSPAASAGGAFALGDRVAAGAFEYLLFHGGNSNGGNPQDGDWYLRNSRPPDPDPIPDPDPDPGPGPDPQPEVPNYRVEVPLYAALPTAAQQLGLSMLGTMHQRRGENFAPHSSPSDSAPALPQAAPAPQPESARVLGEQSTVQADDETVAPQPLIESMTIWCKDPQQQFRCVVTPEQERFYADVASDSVAASPQVESQATAIAQEAAPAAQMTASPKQAPLAMHSNAVWARTFGETGDHDAGERIAVQPLNAADALLEGPKYEYDISGFQLGVDLFRSELPQTYGSQDYLGVYAGASEVNGKVEHLYGGRAGSLSMDGKSVGAYWTHFGARGWYTDAVVQGTRYDHVDARSTAGQGMETDGHGWSASLEGGYPLDIGARGRWMLEPQAQLIYQEVALDERADAYAIVDFGTSQALVGRLGARLARVFALDESTQPRDASIWLQTNLWHSVDETSKTGFATLDGGSTIAFRSELGSVAQFELGASIELTRTAVVYGTINYSRAVNGANADAVGGTLGIRWVW